jgi:hypothetical protein
MALYLTPLICCSPVFQFSMHITADLNFRVNYALSVCNTAINAVTHGSNFVSFYSG